MGKLTNRTALVTGAGQGLGKAIAIAFAGNGARVAVNDEVAARAQEVAEHIRKCGGTAEAFQADVSDPAAVASMVQSITSNLGAIDILVNNAGIMGSCPVLSITPEFWDRVFAVHVRGTFLCSKAVLPHMMEKGYGKILNMSGSYAIGGAENYVHLSAAKGAITGFTRALAREVGPHGICVNAIVPSMIKSDLTEKMDPVFLERLRQRYPLRRLGEMGDVTASALFLACSDSDFYTGQNLCPSGGDVMV